MNYTKWSEEEIAVAGLTLDSLNPRIPGVPSTAPLILPNVPSAGNSFTEE